MRPNPFNPDRAAESLGRSPKGYEAWYQNGAVYLTAPNTLEPVATVYLVNPEEDLPKIRKDLSQFIQEHTSWGK